MSLLCETESHMLVPPPALPTEEELKYIYIYISTPEQLGQSRSRVLHIFVRQVFGEIVSMDLSIMQIKM